MRTETFQQLIRKDEIVRCLKLAYPGKPVTLRNYRVRSSKQSLLDDGPKDVRTYIEKVFPHIILFENGMSCTHAEWVQYIRDNELIPVCTYRYSPQSGKAIRKVGDHV